MSHCPSQDWDRYCAMMERPHPVGKPFLTRSPKQHWCESCDSRINPDNLHWRQDCHNEEGMFCGAIRWHQRNDPECQWTSIAPPNEFNSIGYNEGDF